MRIATWNVNSIRARVDRVTSWLERSDCDVLAIQEIKCSEEQFPVQAFDELGYEVAAHGINQWNGVAICSRIGLDDIVRDFPNQPGFSKSGENPQVEPRAIGATCRGVQVWSLYVPNGRTIDDPHYQYKLEWLGSLSKSAAEWLTDPNALIALVGDWNIAPTDLDVWDIAEFAGSTHVTEPERTAFRQFADLGMTEVTTKHLATPGTYTYWDYKAGRFFKDQGMRIDFQYHSPSLSELVEDVWIDVDERRGKGASDHAPVVADLLI